MDGVTSILLVVLVVIGCLYLGWHWKTEGNSAGDLVRAMQRILRNGLHAANVDEVKAIQVQVNQNQARVENRLAVLESRQATALLGPSPSTSTDGIISRAPGMGWNAWSDSATAVTSSIHSLVWRGLRFTLSDVVWAHAGRSQAADLTDEQVAFMIHGPFCPGCLKRWVGRDAEPTSFLPAQCRFCGFPCGHSDPYDRPIQIKEVKRLAYEYLDREMRNRTENEKVENL